MRKIFSDGPLSRNSAEHFLQPAPLLFKLLGCNITPREPRFQSWGIRCRCSSKRGLEIRPGGEGRLEGRTHADLAVDQGHREILGLKQVWKDGRDPGHGEQVGWTKEPVEPRRRASCGGFYPSLCSSF